MTNVLKFERKLLQEDDESEFYLSDDLTPREREYIQRMMDEEEAPFCFVGSPDDVLPHFADLRNGGNLPPDRGWLNPVLVWVSWVGLVATMIAWFALT